MRFLYNLLTIIIVILAIPVFIVRLIRERGFGRRILESLGFLPQQALEPVAGKGCIWLHAASVGEIVATSPIVKEIRREMPDRPILISVVTASGYEMAKRIIKDADSVIFFPLDLPMLSDRVVRRIRPAAFLPVETELWPNFLYTARRYKVPVVMVNGRISDKSVKRYRYLRGVLTDMLDTVVRFCMQSEIDAGYIIRLGADPSKVVVTGNTKFDQTYTDVSDSEKKALLDTMGLADGEPLIVAGSTHKGEEEYLLEAFKRIRDSFARAKLVIAPRDTMRAGEIIKLAAAAGFKGAKRTELLDRPAEGHDVVVVDTIGELGKIYSIGDVVYVGGSLVPHGGHNILEPAAHAKPIVVGPHMFNFKDSYALFTGRNACLTAADGRDLADKLLYVLENENIKTQMSVETEAIIAENRGAAYKTVQHLKELLKF